MPNTDSRLAMTGNFEVENNLYKQLIYRFLYSPLAKWSKNPSAEQPSSCSAIFPRSLSFVKLAIGSARSDMFFWYHSKTNEGEKIVDCRGLYLNGRAQQYYAFQYRNGSILWFTTIGGEKGGRKKGTSNTQYSFIQSPTYSCKCVLPPLLITDGFSPPVNPTPSPPRC